MSRSLLAFIFIFVSQASDATHDPICGNENQDPLAAIQPEGETDVVAQLHALLEDDELLLKQYANAETSYTTKELLLNPTSSDSTSVKYDLGRRKLKPGECMYLHVPKELRGKPVLFANLHHQQDPFDDTGWENGEDFGDKNPGLTTVQFNKTTTNFTPNWHYWAGMSSGNFGAKFAEKSHMEKEGLYEFYKNGYHSVATDERRSDPLLIDAVRICSIGKDPVTYGSFQLKVHPGKARKYEEINFTNSNRMGDSVTAEGRSYGNLFEGVELSPYSRSNASSLMGGASLEGGKINLPLEEGRLLRSIDLAIGDRHRNGSKGFASLNVYVERADGSRISLIRNENVPPHGVLVGAPEKEHRAELGDKLVISSEADSSFVTGLKIGYD